MSIRLALIGVVSVIALSSTAAQAQDRLSTEIFVSDRGVNFSDAAETATFYTALERAAAKACESGMGRNLSVVAADRQCAQASLDRAVRQMGKSTLAALHETRTGRAGPATILASQ